MREGCLGRTDGLAPLTGDQRRDLLEVIDDRHQRRLQSERVTAFNRNPRRQSSESAGDLADVQRALTSARLVKKTPEKHQL
jgi:hypothetical protein